jgi:hypothetical protein
MRKAETKGTLCLKDTYVSKNFRKLDTFSLNQIFLNGEGRNHHPRSVEGPGEDMGTTSGAINTNGSVIGTISYIKCGMRRLSGWFFHLTIP